VLHHFETTGGHAVPPALPADTVLHHFETTGGHAVPPAPPARSVAAPGQQPARSSDKVLHYFGTTGGHAETVGDGCTIWKQPAAMLCLRRRRLFHKRPAERDKAGGDYLQAQRGTPFETAGGWPPTGGRKYEGGSDEVRHVLTENRRAGPAGGDSTQSAWFRNRAAVGGTPLRNERLTLTLPQRRQTTKGCIMNIKKPVSIMVILCALGTLAAVAQQTQQSQYQEQRTWINPQGEECFSLKGVVATINKRRTKTTFTNYNNYPVTVAYRSSITGDKIQQEFIFGASEKVVNGVAELVSCRPTN
jgi:hypothetical protein